VCLCDCVKERKKDTCQNRNKILISIEGIEIESVKSAYSCTGRNVNSLSIFQTKKIRKKKVLLSSDIKNNFQFEIQSGWKQLEMSFFVRVSQS